MTNDRDNMTADPSVSATYRQLADERTPAGLDEKVLQQAAAAPRIPAGIGRAWMKPLAWAATIGLSLAIVLEMTQLPQAPLDIDVVAPPAPTDERPARVPASTEPAAAKESRNAKPARHRSESGAIEASRALPMAPAQAQAQEATQSTAPEPAPAPLKNHKSTDLQPLADDDMTPDARGDEVAGTAAFAVRAERMLLEPPSALCPESVRKVAEDWYECIEVQKNAVPAARIAEELEEFRKRFPNFQVPDTE
jgi:hypothetical protein